MDYENEKRKRLEALEDKKKRLEAMRKKNQDRADGNAEEVASQQSSASQGSFDVNSLINSILEADATSTNSSIPVSSPKEKAISVSGSDLPRTPHDIIKEKSRNLVTVKKSSGIHILPQLRESYDKMCQTEDSEHDNDKRIVFESPDLSSSKAHYRRSMARPSNASPMPLNFDPLQQSLSSRKPMKLDPEIQRDIIHSDSFKRFVESKSRVVERALGQSLAFDVFKDYTSSDNDSKRQLSDSKILSILNIFDDEFVKSRPVMDIQPCVHHEELFLAAYGAKGQAAFHNRGSTWQLTGSGTGSGSGSDDDPAGVVCIWSLAMPTRPEFKFTSSSPVLTAQFHPSEPHLLVGGCYSGQILLWDMRAKSLPVQRSNLAGKGHKHPVYSLAMLGSAAAYELVTASTDGMLCRWDMSQILEPSNATPILV
eukprot:gene37469-49018_t